MSDQIILQKLNAIEAMVLQQNILSKKILNFKEACSYLGLSSSTLYKHTCKRDIPFYQPEGKKIFFKLEDLDKWLLRNPKISNEDLDTIAQNYLFKKGGRNG